MKREKKWALIKGFWYYTVGQRHGIKLAAGPWYVVSKNTVTNTVVISRAYYTEDKPRDTVTITQCNWITQEPVSGHPYAIKLRHGPAAPVGMVTKQAHDLFHIQLPQRDQGISPGQYAVLYNGTECLGGGIIIAE